MEAIVRARGGRILGARATDALGREVGGRVRDARRRPRRGRRAGAGVGAVAPARRRARRGGGLEPRHRRADPRRHRRRRARGRGHRRRQRHDRRRPGSAGGAGSALHVPHGRPARAAPHPARREALAGVRRAHPDAAGPTARRAPSRRRRAPHPTRSTSSRSGWSHGRGSHDKTTGRDPGAEPMAGAGGGLAGGLWAFAGADAATRRRAGARHDRLRRRDARLVRGRDRRGLDGPPDAARQGRVRGRHPLPPGRRALLRGAGRRPARRVRAPPHERRGRGRRARRRIASEADIERAAKRLARRLLPPDAARSTPSGPPPASARSPRRTPPSSAPR